MKFKIQVLTMKGEVESWEDMRPTKGAIYAFDNREVAERTARTCYPDHPDRVRVVPLDPDDFLPPGSCGCGSTKYKRGHMPWDHAEWQP